MTNLEPLRAVDLPAAGRIMYRSANEFRKNAGLPALTTPLRQPPPLMQHIYAQDPKLSWGGYDGKKLTGYLISHIRDRQWHVAYHFVDPAYQDRGIGRDLLQAGLAEARKRDKYFLSGCTFAYNLKAIGLYSRLGLFPRKDLFVMQRSSKGDWPLPPRPGAITMTPISSVETVIELNRMDCEIRGNNRSADHCYWLADDDHTGYVFSTGDRLAGYAYISGKGSIGPVLAVRDIFLVDILLHCLYEAKDKKNQNIRVLVSGKNFASLQLLMNSGFSFHEIAVLMTNRVFCDMRRYLPHSLVVF